MSELIELGEVTLNIRPRLHDRVIVRLSSPLETKPVGPNDPVFSIDTEVELECEVVSLNPLLARPVKRIVRRISRLTSDTVSVREEALA